MLFILLELGSFWNWVLTMKIQNMRTMMTPIKVSIQKCSFSMLKYITSVVFLSQLASWDWISIFYTCHFISFLSKWQSLCPYLELCVIVEFKIWIWAELWQFWPVENVAKSSEVCIEEQCTLSRIRKICSKRYKNDN